MVLQGSCGDCGGTHEIEITELPQVDALEQALEEQLLASCAFLTGTNGRYYHLKDGTGANPSSSYLIFPEQEGKWAFVTLKQQAPHDKSVVRIPIPIPCPF